MKTKIILSLFAISLSAYVYAQPTLWGMCSNGGTSGFGNIFSIPLGSTNLTSQYDFSSEGTNPYGSLIQASNGKLYGMASQGGAFGLGVIFEFNPSTNVCTSKISFDYTNGRIPFGSLMQASNGKLYGMTGSGGSSGNGVLFEYDISSNTLEKKIDFDGENGSNTLGSLVQAGNGKLYGMTQEGGLDNLGVLFEYDISTNTLTKKIDFNGTNGRTPYGNLTLASNGKLYGMTEGGGPENYGVLFEFDILSGVLNVKHNFNSGIVDCNPNDTCFGSGFDPRGSLIQASNGKLYGMTASGGRALLLGALFEYDFNTDIYLVKSYLQQQAIGTLMQASNGKLYGTTVGYYLNPGQIFEYDIQTNEQTIKYVFSGTDGLDPGYMSLVEVKCVNNIPVSFSGLDSSYFENDLAVTLTGNPAGGTFNGVGVNSNSFDPTLAGIGGPYSIEYSVLNSGCLNTTSQNTTVNAYTAVVLNLKLFLQGLYTGNGLMQSLLYNIGVNDDPTVADSITIELHDASEPYGIIETANGLLHTDGTVQLLFSPGVINRSYYIAIRYRNSLETWSREPILFDSQNRSFDFSVQE